MVAAGNRTHTLIGVTAARRSAASPTAPAIPLAGLMVCAAIAALLLGDWHVLRARWPELVSALPGAAVANVALAALALVLRAVTFPGALSRAAVGTVLLATSGWPGWTMLAVAFVVALLSTRWRRIRKVALGIAEARGGRRGVGNVLANTGLGALLAVVAYTRPAESGWVLGIAASLAAAASDTVASEVGKGLGGRTWLLVPWQLVPPGTTGAASVGGTAASLLAGALFGGVALASGLLHSPAQAAMVAVSAMVACLLEGIVAAAVEPRHVLDNDGVNFFTSVSGAAVAVGATLVLG